MIFLIVINIIFIISVFTKTPHPYSSETLLTEAGSFRCSPLIYFIRSYFIIYLLNLYLTISPLIVSLLTESYTYQANILYSAMIVP